MPDAAAAQTELVFVLERRGHGWGEEIIPHLVVEERPIAAKKSPVGVPAPWEVGCIGGWFVCGWFATQWCLLLKFTETQLVLHHTCLPPSYNPQSTMTTTTTTQPNIHHHTPPHNHNNSWEVWNNSF